MNFYATYGAGGGGGGSGDVVGPISSTDNAVARFDGTTGKLIQNSVVIVGDTGNVTGVAALTASGNITGANLSGTNTGDVTIGTANGLSLVGQALSLGLSSGATTGALSATDWNTFNNKQGAITTGNLTAAGADGISVTNGNGAVIGSGTSIQQQAASASQNGYLTSSDWTTFNNKGSGTVTAVSVTSANGFAGSSSGGATPALTLSTTVSGVLKGNGTAVSAAVSGTDYAPATSGTAILKGNGSGGFSSAVANTDYLPATSGSAIQKANGSGGLTAASAGTDYAPATSGTAILKGNGSGGFSSASAGTDYAPATSGSSILYGNGSGGFSNVTVGTGLSFSGGTLATTSSGAAEFVVIRDQKTSGTDGGTFTSGAWRTRDLNTLVNPNSYSWVSLSSNQFTLSAGTYFIDGMAPAYKVSLHKTKIYNVTDTADSFMGSNAISTTTAGTQTDSPSFVKGIVVIAGTKTFELQHQCASTFSVSGYGNATGWGTEVYSILTIAKLA